MTRVFSRDKNFSSWGHLTDNDQQHSHKGQEGDVERAAERYAGDDEGDDEDEEADDHQSGHGFGPGCRRKQRQVNQRGKKRFLKQKKWPKIHTLKSETSFTH